MKFFTDFTMLGLFLILLTDKYCQTKASEDQELADALLSGISMGLYFIPPPVGPVLGTLSAIVVELVSSSMDSTDAKSETMFPVSNGNFLRGIMRLEKFTREESQRAIREIKSALYSELMVNELRDDLTYLLECYRNDCYRCLVTAESCPEETKQSIVSSLINPTSNYRTKLSAFVSTYIIAKDSPVDYAERASRIFRYIAEKNHELAKDGKDCCTKSVQTRIFDLAMYIMSVLAKSYTMVINAHFEKYNEYTKKSEEDEAGKWLGSIKKITDDFRMDIYRIVWAAKKSFEISSRDIRACDPYKHERNVTYERLTHFIQAMLYAKYSSDVGDHKCVSRRLVSAPFPFTDRMSLNTKAIPYELNAIFIDPDEQERLYHRFARFKTTGFLGMKENEVATYGKNISNDNLKAYSFPGFCEMNVCYVDMINNINSVRKFSADIVDTSPEFVVTGFRWRIINKTVFIQIQEGKLVNGSNVDPKTVNWKPITLDHPCPSFILIRESFRSFCFDDLILPPETFVTGVVIAHHSNCIGLRIQGWLVRTGEIMELSPPTGASQREELFLNNSDASEFAPTSTQHDIMSTTRKHFVKFQPTGFEQDAGQTTIPYLDIQDVITLPPTPIAGIGTYYKGMIGYGGFIGLKLISLEVFYELEKAKTAIIREVIDVMQEKIGI